MYSTIPIRNVQNSFEQKNENNNGQVRHFVVIMPVVCMRNGDVERDFKVKVKTTTEKREQNTHVRGWPRNVPMPNRSAPPRQY